jgi:hypothetical protein
MKLRNWGRSLTGAVVILLGGAAAAHAQSAAFLNINDAVASRFFDPATSAADVINPNKLIIGLHSGSDPATWKSTVFRASTEAFSHTSAMDTISFTVEAPAGFYVSKVTYSQRGTGSAVRTGKAAGGANWVVAGFASNLGLFGTNPTLSATADLSGMMLTSVPVSITTGLFAFATPTSGSATLTVTGADVTVEVVPLP